MASPKALGPEAGKEQCLGGMPWKGRATAIEPDAIFLMQTEVKVKKVARCFGHGDLHATGVSIRRTAAKPADGAAAAFAEVVALNDSWKRGWRLRWMIEPCGRL
jgi:hypothetical protein